jgi:GDP-L-fucose synthase
MRLLITGGNGYIAKSLSKAFITDININLTVISKDNFNLTNQKDTINFFKSNGYFDVVIHCAVAGGNRLKEDDISILDNNLSMYYNLLANREYFNKLIHFGSGAEMYAKDTPYGLSKNIIRKSILSKPNFYNIRIFGVFDENELDTRFIKSNILRYISKKPMEIYEDKKMTFFYMKDLVKLVYHIIFEDSKRLVTESHCSYKTSYSLLDIANIINDLSDYKVPIVIGNNNGIDYESKINVKYDLQYIGLIHGIIETYNKLKN